MGAKINNTEIIKNLIDKAKIELSVDKAPSELAEKIVPVIIAATSEKLIQVASVGVSDATAGTIHTTSSTKSTYLVGAFMTVAKSALSDSIYTSIAATMWGGASLTGLFNINYEPSTAASNLTHSMMFPLPIKLEKNTTITINNSTATASIDAGGYIFYYEVDD